MPSIRRSMHVVASDFHVPFHDKELFRLFLAFLRRERPGHVHLLGDIADFWHTSRFNKDPHRVENIQDDLDAVVRVLRAIRKAAPRAHIVYTEGNHEERIAKYLATQARELAHLRCLHLPELLQLDRLGIEYRSHLEPYFVGHLMMLHGQVVRKWSAYTARANMERYGCSVLCGHTHRQGTFKHTDANRIAYRALENGCMCSFDAEYVLFPDWQQGWSVVWLHEHGYFHPVQIEYIHGLYAYHDKLYGKHRKPSRARFKLSPPDLTTLAE